MEKNILLLLIIISSQVIIHLMQRYHKKVSQWIWFKWKDKNISNKRKNKNISNKDKIKIIASLFIGQSCFNDDGSQTDLIYQSI